MSLLQLTSDLINVNNFLNISLSRRVHVRRTDKINVEASYHSLEEYMYWVDLYYKKLSLTQKVLQKNVYLASDDATVLPEAKKK